MSKGGDRRRSFACLQQLAGQFPAAFLTDGSRKPLKIGIWNDLALHGISRGVIQRGLAKYCSNYRYLVAMQEGAVRVGLDGEPAGTVTADEAAHARQQLAERLKPTKPPPAKAEQPKSNPQPKPKAPLKAPPQAQTDVRHELSTPFRKGSGAGSKPAVVVEHKPSWKYTSGGPKRRVINA
jgi:ProP effector